MTVVQFWGGLGVIGSSKITLTEGSHRVMLDIGLDIPSQTDLFRAPVRERAGRELADRLRLGMAPRVPGLWDRRWLSDEDAALAEPTEETAVFASHAHIDHTGLAGFVRAGIPMHAHADTVRVLDALEASGERLAGAAPQWIPLQDGEIRDFGPFSVQCIRVDHDVPGASGYLVTCPDGVLAFTGDLRFHGEHPELTQAFVERVRGVDAFVTEGTLMSFDPPEGVIRDEAAVNADFVQTLDHAGLVLLSVYPRDVERAAEFTALARQHGRTILWPAQVADFLQRMGVEAAPFTEELLDEVRAQPASYVIQPDTTELPSLLDLPITPGTPFFHANGAPLGEFDPHWAVFADWLAALGVTLLRRGSSGHATADAIFAMIETIHPKVVFPIHTMSPTRFLMPSGVRRVIPHYGERFDLRGNLLAAD
ncbi:MBL fold metallo-hydrolase [Flexivirga caeni]|uniref:MBL fold metallo-hydrolase n=1 Tax=Flexivirga caeni TaxID=2294115 RepID=A0A3M9MCB2_9MICO|nr:MBL fold metallo-hydrolase [Flexivirga caeni]RNI22228.1 MBL fold metallo-hydrolase [Flexivirga caeni]